VVRDQSSSCSATAAWMCNINGSASPYHSAGSRNAAHPVNAIMNYAYAALESEIRIKAISDGYDPTIGIMHEGSDGSSKFNFRFNGAGATEGRSFGIGFRQGTRFRSSRRCHSKRWRLSVESGNGADGRGAGYGIKLFNGDRPEST
jgi:hypothetical protein